MWLDLADRNEWMCVRGGTPCKAAAGERGAPLLARVQPCPGVSPLSP